MAVTPGRMLLHVPMAVAMLCSLAVVAGAPQEELVEALQKNNEVRIVGGFPALAASTRHQVSIRQRSVDEASFGRGHMCGGSLINNVTVLTAAHCLVESKTRVRPASFFRVVGGHTNRLQTTQFTEIRRVKRVVIHERYNPATFDNDVGILTLDSPIPASHPTLHPVAMTSVSPSPLTVCQTSGWGTMLYGTNNLPAELMAVNITVQSTAQCNANTSYNGQIQPGMLCVGQFEGGRDACQGDSGGPLVCNGLLAGIVSHGDDCGKQRFPGVYADVAFYRDWIVRNGTPSQVTSIWLMAILAAVVSYFAAV